MSPRKLHDLGQAGPPLWAPAFPPVNWRGVEWMALNGTVRQERGRDGQSVACCRDLVMHQLGVEWGLEGQAEGLGSVLGALGSLGRLGSGGSALGPCGGQRGCRGARGDWGMDGVQILLSPLDTISPLGDSGGASSRGASLGAASLGAASSGAASLGAGLAASLPLGAFLAAAR